jgi:predicted ATPase
MITLIQARNFRSLRYIQQPLGDFNVLVGPNASGKTTFLSVLTFVNDILTNSIDAAFAHVSDFTDMTWNHNSDSIAIAIEARIPQHLLDSEEKFDTVRYEMELRVNDENGAIEFFTEAAMFLSRQHIPIIEALPELFPAFHVFKEEFFIPKTKKGLYNKHSARLISKVRNGNDNFYPEPNRLANGNKKQYSPSFRLGPRRSALKELPADETIFPVLLWFRELLTTNLQSIFLDSVKLRKASPPTLRSGFLTDGSNLPWLVFRLMQHTERYQMWIEHIRTALPDVESIRSIERPDDKHRYIQVTYTNGLQVPSWLLSDGTLRLFALTLIAYLPEIEGVFLIEEPENGIHPTAVETVVQSLRSLYGSQILLATHSPVILNAVEASDILCFNKTSQGETDIVRGHLHPRLRDWKGSPNLGVLLAGGVLE